jgi:predicted dehydrogenase
VAESIVWTHKFPSGIVASCACGFGAAKSRRYRVHCEEGWFELDPAFSYQGLKLKIKDEKAMHELQLEPVNHFAKEMDHFSQCILENKHPWTPGEEGLADMTAMARIEESIASGRTVRVSA